MQPEFAVYFVGDAYSTDQKIMGRQSAGKSFMRGLARTWPKETITGFGVGGRGPAMARQLESEGFAGKLRWIEIPHWKGLSEAGVLYNPSPGAKELAASRNAYHPAAFSIMNVTFTLSSDGAMDAVSQLIMPPYKPWDALICISDCGLQVVKQLQDETRAWWSAQTGATRFNTPQMPVIPLGVDCPAFVNSPEKKSASRTSLGIVADECVFLFAGRLTFHAKANPGPMYQALEAAAKAGTRITCVEAGVFPNPAVQQAYEAARRALAPSVRFIWVDGKDAVRYREAWQAADVFVSLSDNIQETFGLTPVEAMAAGLPVIVSDWNGYKETVRDGVDGIRVPTILPQHDAGADLALAHALGLETYDHYIGRVSLATVVHPGALAQACTRMAQDAALRARMGAAGQARAREMFDWPVILQRYNEFAQELNAIRRAGESSVSPERWPQRPDPFALFAHFPSATLRPNWRIYAVADAAPRLRELAQLAVANYSFDAARLRAQDISAILEFAVKHDGCTVGEALGGTANVTAPGMRALMWLWKFNLVDIRPAQ